MSTARAGMKGTVPKVVIGKAPPKEYSISKEDLIKIAPELAMTDEQKKYIKCWEVDDYRKVAPGERLVDLFLETADPKEGVTIVDWGCGTGRASKKLYEAGLDVTMVDFAFNCLDDEVKALAEDNDRMRFMEHDLNKRITLPSQYGFCTDVMEHIPEDEIDAVLDTILDNSRHVFFQISTSHDVMGNHPDIDEELHVSVHDYQYWIERFVGKKVIIHHSNDLPGAAIFYVTGFSNTPFKWDGGTVNVDDEQIIKNMERNAKFGFQHVKPHESQDVEVMLLAGGPSLNEFEDEIRANRLAGMPMITTNGTLNWALTRGLKPSMQCLIDGRDMPHNHSFTAQIDGLTDETKYCVASQCPPDALKRLPPDRTFLWQVSLSDELLPDIKRIYGKMYDEWYPAPGGSSVTTRAICLLRMLGFHKIHVYGFDSCLMEDKHHAYDQPANDKDLDRTMEIKVGGGTKYEKTFTCAPWHAYQAKDFLQMVPRVLSDAKLNIKGDGLIAYMINTGAAMADPEEI